MHSWVWLFILSTKNLRFTNVIGCITSVFLLLLSSFYGLTSLFLHSPMEEHLACYQVIMDKTMNICVCFCMNIIFHYSPANTQERNTRSYIKGIFNLIKLQTVYVRNSNCSVFLSALDISFIDFSHSNRCLVVSH